MKTLEKALKSYFNTSDSERLDLKHVFYDSEKSNFYLCNGYGLIRLNCNSQHDKDKIDYIIKTYGLSDNKELTDKIIAFDKEFLEDNHCNYIDIGNNVYHTKDIFNEKVVNVNGRCFKVKEINRIKRILGGKVFGTFYSEQNDTTLSITSKNGYAFLLGCMR